MAMKERAVHPEQSAKTPMYSPEMTDAEVAALVARLHRDAAARTHPDPHITDSAEVVRQMRGERDATLPEIIEATDGNRYGKI
jgi:hypothetical protein